MKLRWGRIVVGGLLAEVALIIAIVPLGLRSGDAFLQMTAPPGSFIVCFFGAWWVGRRLESPRRYSLCQRREDYYAGECRWRAAGSLNQIE